MKNNNNNNKSFKSNNGPGPIDQRIQDITTKLEQLKINYIRETNKLKEEIAEVKLQLEQEETNEFRVPREEDRSITLGSTVRITNNYKGEYGVIRTAVTSIDKYWVWIKDPLETEHKQIHKNVERLKYDIREYRVQGNRYYGSTGFKKR